jgi:hypothetical protein
MGAVKKKLWKNFKQDYKRPAVVLWKAKVPPCNIRSQMKMSEYTLRRGGWRGQRNSHSCRRT